MEQIQEPTHEEKRLAALSCLRFHSKLPRDTYELVVFRNFADAFTSLRELLDYADEVRASRKGIHGRTENAIVRDYRDGYSVLAISRDRGISVEVVEEIIDRRLKGDGR